MSTIVALTILNALLVIVNLLLNRVQEKRLQRLVQLITWSRS